MATNKGRVPITRELVARLPKSDLHVHLDGSLRLETLIELSKQREAATIQKLVRHSPQRVATPLAPTTFQGFVR